MNFLTSGRWIILILLIFAPEMIDNLVLGIDLRQELGSLPYFAHKVSHYVAGMLFISTLHYFGIVRLRTRKGLDVKETGATD